MDSRFARHLSDLLRRRGLTQRAFARGAGCSPGYLSQVLRGEAAAPDDIGRWAEVLGLEGEERERFLDHAAFTRTPERVLDRLAHMEDLVLRRLHPADQRAAEPRDR